MILSAIIEEAKKQNLDQYISGTQVVTRILERRGKEEDSQKNPFADLNYQQMEIELSFDAPEGSVDKIKEIAQSVKEKNSSSIEYEINQKLAVGNKFPNYGEIKKVFGEGTAELSAKQGQVLLVDVWATWCGPCQAPMSHNQQMLEKNNWGDKVRIVGVSVDEEIEDVRKRVETRKWDKVEHLTLGKWDQNHLLIKSFCIQGIPFVCLVNTHGIIQYTGHPNSINLQDKINQLIGNKSESKTEENENKKENTPKKQISIEDSNKLFETAMNKKFFNEYFGKLDFISSKITIETKATGGKISNEATVEVYVRSEDQNVLEQYEKLLPSKDVNFTSKVVATQTVPPVPEACKECKGQLKYPLYWCYWSAEPADFRCRQCVEKKIDETHYSYPQNSILLMGEVKSIGKSALGKNLQPTEPVQKLSPHMFSCNGCRQGGFSVGQPRYICLGCRTQPNHRGDFIDLCPKCIDKFIAKDEEVIEALNQDGHKSDHALLRVLYNTKSYYTY